MFVLAVTPPHLPPSFSLFVATPCPSMALSMASLWPFCDQYMVDDPWQIHGNSMAFLYGPSVAAPWLFHHIFIPGSSPPSCSHVFPSSSFLFHLLPVAGDFVLLHCHAAAQENAPCGTPPRTASCNVSSQNIIFRSHCCAFVTAEVTKKEEKEETPGGQLRRSA